MPGPGAGDTGQGREDHLWSTLWDTSPQSRMVLGCLQERNSTKTGLHRSQHPCPQMPGLHFAQKRLHCPNLMASTRPARHTAKQEPERPAPPAPRTTCTSGGLCRERERQDPLPAHTPFPPRLGPVAPAGTAWVTAPQSGRRPLGVLPGLPRSGRTEIAGTDGGRG